MFGRKKPVISEKIEEKIGEKIEENQEAQSAEKESVVQKPLESGQEKASAEILPEEVDRKVLETPATDSNTGFNVDFAAGFNAGSAADSNVGFNASSAASSNADPTTDSNEKILEKPLADVAHSGTAPKEAASDSGSAAFGAMDLFPLLQDIQKRLGTLEDTFQQKLMHTAQEEKILDSMHEELQKYRSDLYANQLRPVLSELCNICDSILRNKEIHQEKAKADGVEEPLIPLKLLADYVFDIQDLLANNNVLIYRTEKGMAFDPTKHRAIKKVPTAEEGLHGKIAESQSNGYQYCSRNLSPEKVSVYFFEKPAEMKEGGQQ